jgi:predicted metal-binding membrane protein
MVPSPSRRWLALGGAAAVTAAAWVVTVRNAAGMSAKMPMPGGWSMSMAWMPIADQSGVQRAAMFLTMWTVMMVAMMLPSVMPVVLLHRGLLAARETRRAEAQGEEAGASGSNLLLLAGYFAVWVEFGVIAYGIGTLISSAVMSNVSLSRVMPAVTGATLAVAGLYQLTAWKRICLSHCRSPLDFFSRHPVRTPTDSLMLGLHHGAYCAGCCWALMVIQLALGIMSVPLMMAVAGVIFLEKQWRYGQKIAIWAGIAALAGGAFLIGRALI